MNRTTAKILREKLNAVFAEHGIDGYDINVGNATFDDVSVTFKVEIREQGAGSQEERDLETYAKLYNLDTTKIATVQGNKYSLVGFNTRARKQPFIIQKLGVGDKASKYKITEDQAKRYFGHANATA